MNAKLIQNEFDIEDDTLLYSWKKAKFQSHYDINSMLR
jgi:hypothetical protein